MPARSLRFAAETERDTGKAKVNGLPNGPEKREMVPLLRQNSARALLYIFTKM